MIREEFDEDKLSMSFSLYGRPYEKYYNLSDSKLFLKCIAQSLTDEIHPVSFVPQYRKDAYAAFVGKCQRKIDTTVTCQMQFLPENEESAGLAVMQAMNHQYHVERAVSAGKQVVRVVRYKGEYNCPPYLPGFEFHAKREVLIEQEWDDRDIVLQIQMEGEKFMIRVGTDRQHLKDMIVADGKEINPEYVGCMAGTMIGMFASGHGTSSDNQAAFDWFEIN